MSVNEKSYQNPKALELLGKIYQEEMAGITRYLHYSFMNKIIRNIIGWTGTFLLLAAITIIFFLCKSELVINL